MRHQFIIMLQCLTEPESRIEDDILHSQITKLLHFTGKIQENFLYQILIMRFFLHTLRSSLHMHHNIRYSQFGYCCKHPVIHLTGCYIIDNSNSVFLHTAFCHLRPKCIYGNDSLRMIPVQDFQPGTKSAHLFFGRDMFGIRTRRISAYINNRSTLIQNLPGTGGYFFFSLHPATGIKRIGSYIQNPHYLRSSEVKQPPFYIYINRRHWLYH